MDVGNQRHVVSIDVLIGDEDRECRQISANKNRLTILVGCNNKYPSRVSIHKNLPPSIDSIRRAPETDNSAQKYYFHRKNKKQKKIGDGGLTQRKPINGVTTSLCRGRQASKSYRIHTIDYIEQNDKKQQNKKHEYSIVNLTKKHNNFTEIFKNKIKKKSIINQCDFTEFNVNLKNKREKQGITIDLKHHRKLNKAKTEFEEEHLNIRQQEPEDKKNLMSERKFQQEGLLKKIQFKRNKIKNLISSHSQRDTIQMKIDRKQASITENDKISTHEQDINLLQTQKKSQEKLSKNFNDYLGYIERKKNQAIKSKGKRFHHLNDSRSLVMKSTLIKETICLKMDSKPIEIKQNIQPAKIQQTPNSQKGKAQKKNIPKQQKCQEKLFLNSPLECSTIQQINQSSFLSSTGMKQIITTTTAFEPLDTNNPYRFKQPSPVKEDKIKSTIQVSTIPVQQSPRKKKRKKQSKMSLICRSDVKQKFPQRFFD